MHPPNDPSAPPPNIATPSDGVNARTIGPDDAIGPYRLMSVLGEGGFGVVYAAERREPFVQRVAVKVLKPGMDSRGVLARFEQERQALAVMDHPNVARVLDGGLTDSQNPLGPNLPYFVMEYVHGDSILAFCEKNQLTLRQKLELFLPVCDAVQHAHMKGIVHRDLKPSNILIAPPTTTDGSPVPKVIDFGIAKAVGGALTDATILTERGQFIGTPEYMSPEQADAKVDIDTRTDVYSLGVILYQLLTGELPFSHAEFRAAGLAEILRIIKEVDPPKPSTRLSALLKSAIEETRQGTRSTVVSTPTRTAQLVASPSSVVRQLRGDLDWVIMRALEKSRNRRYESVSSLAADIRRYLRTEPVDAGPPSAAYRITKFVRRHRVFAAAAAVCSVALISGLVMAIYGLREAQRERDTAIAAQNAERIAKELALKAEESEKVQRIRAENALEFVWSAITVSNPWLEPQDLTLRQLIDRFEKNLELKRGELDTESEREVRYQIAALYSSLGSPQLAIERIEPVIKSLQPVASPLPRMAIDAYLLQATALNTLGQSSDAIAALDVVRPVAAKPSTPSERSDAARVQFEYGRSYLQLGRREDAELAFKQSIDLFESLGDPPVQEVASGASGLAMLYSRWAGRQADAIAPALRALEISRANDAPNSPVVQNALNILARTYEVNGRFEEAIENYRASIAAHESRDSRPSDQLANAQANLAFLLRDLGRPEEAMTFLHKSLATRRALNPKSIGVADLLDLLATLRMDTGGDDNLRTAVDLFKDELTIVDQPDPSMQPVIARCLTGLSLAYLKLNQPQEALDISRRAVELRESYLAPGDWRIDSSRSVHAAALSAIGRFEEAEPIMLQAATAIQASTTLAPLKKAAIIQRAVDMYTAWGKPEKAAEWSKRLPPGYQTAPSP